MYFAADQWKGRKGMVYRFMKLFGLLVRILPPGARCVLAGLIGNLTWYVVPKKRKNMAVRNIIASLCVSEAEAWRIAKKSWTRFGKMIVEVLCFPDLKCHIKSAVRFEGKEHLDAALKQGRGIVLATSHSGNWEMLGAALALNGYPLVAVAKKQSNRQMDRLINEYRTAVGMHVTYKTGVVEMAKMLGKGYVIGLLMDQDGGRDGAILNFLGRPASCVKGPAFLARLKAAPVVPAFITGNEDGSHTVLMKPALYIEKTADKEADIVRLTERLNLLLEEHIRTFPEEWFWMHDRWRYTEGKGV